MTSNPPHPHNINGRPPLPQQPGMANHHVGSIGQGESSTDESFSEYSDSDPEHFEIGMDELASHAEKLNIISSSNLQPSSGQKQQQHGPVQHIPPNQGGGSNRPKNNKNLYKAGFGLAAAALAGSALAMYTHKSKEHAQQQQQQAHGGKINPALSGSSSSSSDDEDEGPQPSNSNNINPQNQPQHAQVHPGYGPPPQQQPGIQYSQPPYLASTTAQYPPISMAASSYPSAVPIPAAAVGVAPQNQQQQQIHPPLTQPQPQQPAAAVGYGANPMSSGAIPYTSTAPTNMYPPPSQPQMVSVSNPNTSQPPGHSSSQQGPTSSLSPTFVGMGAAGALAAGGIAAAAAAHHHHHHHQQQQQHGHHDSDNNSDTDSTTGAHTHGVTTDDDNDDEEQNSSNADNDAVTIMSGSYGPPRPGRFNPGISQMLSNSTIDIDDQMSVNYDFIPHPPFASQYSYSLYEPRNPSGVLRERNPVLSYPLYHMNGLSDTTVLIGAVIGIKHVKTGSLIVPNSQLLRRRDYATNIDNISTFHTCYGSTMSSIEKNRRNSILQQQPVRFDGDGEEEEALARWQVWPANGERLASCAPVTYGQRIRLRNLHNNSHLYSHYERTPDNVGNEVIAVTDPLVPKQDTAVYDDNDHWMVERHRLGSISHEWNSEDYFVLRHYVSGLVLRCGPPEMVDHHNGNVNDGVVS
ncbi:hypothetical protein H4219_004683, partial [Mycoemilia scoparia]